VKEGNTTLSVPKEFADHLRDDIDGANDYQRLHNWAEENYSDSYNNSITLEDIRDAMTNLVIDTRTGEIMKE
jgi:hypothetical protein